MKIATTRVETFSDGVIAIIITIMVLALKLPDYNHGDTKWGMRHYILQILPYFISYAFSFMMIGIFWIHHHHMFHLLKRTDEKLLWLNLIFLFWMSLIPITTAVVGANPRLSESLAIYGFVMLMTTVAFAFMRSYTIKKELVHRSEDRAMNKKIRIVSLKAKTKSYIVAFVYLLSIPLAYISIYIAYACFIGAAIVFFIPDGIDDETLAEKIIEKNQ
jgi:uncharacterized membrane protein